MMTHEKDEVEEEQKKIGVKKAEEERIVDNKK